MAFNDKEISNDGGMRLALYAFRWGNKTWHFTNADRSITYGVDPVSGAPAVYEPIAISDEGVAMGKDIGNDFTIQCPVTNPVALLFRGTPPSGRVYVKVRRMQYGETDAPLWWSGTVGNVKPKQGGAGATMVCRSSFSRVRTTGLRLAWTRQCPYALYDHNCKVNPAAFESARVIASVVGNVVTIVTAGAGLDPAAGYFSGGIIKWDIGGGTMEWRMIEVHSAPLVFTLFGRGDGLAAAMNVKLYPGCDRTTGAGGCVRFANIDNYGGHEYMPGTSPFDGNPVF